MDQNCIILYAHTTEQKCRVKASQGQLDGVSLQFTYG